MRKHCYVNPCCGDVGRLSQDENLFWAACFVSCVPILLIYLGYSMDPATCINSTVEVESGGVLITLGLGPQGLAHNRKKAEM